MTDESEEFEDWLSEGEGDEVDPELMALAEERSRGSALRPILFVAVIALGFWIIGDFWSDVTYFFSPKKPVELGDATSLQMEELPHNRLVSISGIPKRRSQSRKYRYFKLVGAPVYVEVPRGESLDPIKSAADDTPDGDVDRTYFEGEGRMIAFAKMPERYRGIKHYYRRQYGTRFCELIDDKERRRIRRERRSAVIENWREQYEKASQQEREQQGLTPEPTDAEIEEILGASPICIDAYLMRTTITPWRHWWYLLTAAIFAIFMLVNVYWLIRWFQKFFGSDVDLSHIESDES